MNDDKKYILIWTISWFIFISILCFIFKKWIPFIITIYMVINFLRKKGEKENERILIKVRF